MTTVITTDLHLTDSPSDEYRWEVFGTIAQEKPTRVFILGDLCDKKDRHSARLVNRLVRGLRRFVQKGAEVIILKGNHDAAVPGSEPFYGFLSEIPSVLFITAPYAMGEILLLPWSPNPRDEWTMNMARYKCIMMHQTMTGAVTESGRVMTSDNMITFPANAKVYSGDIHVPQDIGGVRYVGAPHPMRYGDTYICRILLLDENYNSSEVRLSPPAKRLIEITSVDDLKNVRTIEGDQAKVRITLPSDRLVQWPIEQDRIKAWAAEAGIMIGGIEVIVETAASNTSITVSHNWLSADPVSVLIAFAESEGLDEALLIAGYDLLDQRLNGDIA